MKKAFTLIELSIVLIIIGLLIGGILAGQELITQAKIRGLVKDLYSVQTAVNTFKGKYNWLPGDFPGAGKIWPACGDSSVPGGCNGNGNWIIEQVSGDGNESLRVWQHLSLANMINQTHAAISVPTDVYQIGYSPQAFIGVRGNATFLSGISSTQNWYEIGGWNNSNGLTDIAGMTPQDTYGLDSKIDDGIANSGKFYGTDGTNAPSGGCSYQTGSSNTGSPTYNLTGFQGNYCRSFYALN